MVSALAILQYALGHPLGTRSPSTGQLASLAMFLWLVYVWLTRIRLVTDVGDDHLAVRLKGLSRHHRVALAKVRSAAVVEFDPMKDFGGYGIRTLDHGRAYVAGGRHGVRLELEGSGFVIVGSNRPGDLLASIDRVRRSGRSGPH